MAIEETVTRHVAEVDWTDECTVVLRTRKKRTELTVADAITYAGEIVAAASAALDAAHEAVREVPLAAVDQIAFVSPDCRDGNKHAACIGRAWDDVADAETTCECACHWETITTSEAAAA